MHTAIARCRATRGGALLCTSTGAAASLSALLLLTGCQPAAKVSAFADTPAQQVTEARLGQAGAMEPLAPYDEHFYTPPPESAEAGASAP